MLRVVIYALAEDTHKLFSPFSPSQISISPDSRNTSRVSFDGRNDQELNHGDSLKVTTSIYPVPSICSQDQISDWFDSLAEGLHWNVRKRQKCLDELSDLTTSGSEDRLDEFDNLKIEA